MNNGNSQIIRSPALRKEKPKSMDDKRRKNHKVSNLIWIFTGNYGNILFSVASFLTYAYFLSPEEFGIGIFCIAIVESIGVIYGSTIEDPLVRRKQILKSEISSTFWIGGGLSVASALIGLGIAYISDYSFMLLIMFCFTKLIFSVLCRPMVAMGRQLRQFKLLSIRTLVARFMGTCVGIAIAVNGGGAWALVSQAVCIELFSFLLLLRVSHGHLSSTVSWSVFMQIAREGLPIGLKACFWSMLTRGTIIVLGLVSTPAILGYFGFANRLVRLPLTASTNSLNSYALPVLSGKVQRQEDVSEFFHRLTLATVAIFTPVFLLAAVLAPWFIPMIFGAKWQQAVEVFQWLSLIFGLKFCMIYIGKVLAAHGKARLGLGKEFINLCLFFIVLCLLAPLYGAIAVVIALAVHACIDLVIKSYSLSRLITIKASPLILGLLRIWFVCALMMAAAYASLTYLPLLIDPVWSEALLPWLIMGLSCLISGAVYLCAMGLFFPHCFHLVKGLLSR